MMEKDYQEVNMKGVESKDMNAMVELIFNGKTEIKVIECEEFKKHIEESSSEDKEDKTSKTNMKKK